jgi:hypothetical protein
VTEKAIDDVLALDIKGTMLIVHEFGQRMVQRDGGASPCDGGYVEDLR